MKLRLIADQAIGEIHTRQSDGLGFDTYARVLAQAALDTPGPFTIGVFGEWGTGKTSLMRLIQANLKTEPNVVTVWFNAWRYEKEEHPIVPLIGTIIRQLEEHRDLSEKFGDSVRGLIRALRAVAYGFSAKSTVKIPGFAEVEASFIAKDMIDRKEKITPDPLLDRSLYYGAFNSLEAVQLGRDLRVVILIDDLDRCFPDQAIRLLESIKLVLAQPGFIFVLGVARRVIEGYLQHRYSSDFGIRDFKGHLYLDKIVQLPFHIPPASGRMGDFCALMLSDQPGEITTQLSEILPIVAEALGGNPRSVIRFINNVLIDLAINRELAETSLMEQIPLNYFAISRCLEDRWPEVFTPLEASAQLAHEVSSWDRSSLEVRAEKSGPEARIAASMVSDQRLAELLLGDHGKSWLNNPDLRAASIGFLRTQRRTSSLDVAEVPFRYDAILSYSKEDQPHVVELAKMLNEFGLRVFFDVDIPADSEWTLEATGVARKSQTICFCMGKRIPGSPEVETLRQIANTSTSNIIFVLFPGADPASIPNDVSRSVWVDLRSGIRHEDVLVLADNIRRRIESYT